MAATSSPDKKVLVPIDKERVARMVQCMLDALTEFGDGGEQYSVAELLSAELSVFLMTAKTIIEQDPLTRHDIERSVALMMARILPKETIN